MTERVGRERLVEANAKIGVSDSASQLIGPGLAGALIHWLGAPFAILLDALAFFVSAVILRGIEPRASDAPKMAARNIAAEIGEGLGAIWRNTTLRALAWALALWQVFRHAYLAIGVLFAARELGFSAGHVGALWMLAGVGSLAPPGAAEPLHRRLGFGAPQPPRRRRCRRAAQSPPRLRSDHAARHAGYRHRLARHGGRERWPARGLAGLRRRPCDPRLQRHGFLHQLPDAAPGGYAGRAARARHRDHDLPHGRHRAARRPRRRLDRQPCGTARDDAAHRRRRHGARTAGCLGVAAPRAGVAGR